MIDKENKTEVQEVLDSLRWRLENKLAAQLPLKSRPSVKGYCLGIEDAIRELEQVQDITLKSQSHTPLINLPVLESTTSIGHGVTLECWFIRAGTNITRSDIYHLEDGSVVAYQDTVNGQRGLLHMDAVFKALQDDEDDFNTILEYAGVFDTSKIPVFYTGR